MKKIFTLIFLGLLPILSTLSHAKTTGCHSWPMNMAEAWMQNAKIVDIPSLDESKTKIKLLALGKKKKGLYTQIYHFVFYDRKGNSYEVITKNEASDDECSMSDVDSYLISKSHIH
ncbi:hypothetical protein BGI30_10570 [Snodgrassella alvi]|uniref:hypothetical protein n=1 Tax=Snodgrassella alvi TaxID=1196083 RepID=UPI000C1E69B5|nr:hypothetical protein [Snodgrassella alvi]PIT07259.1 hypothetical protein BGI30_10570 [Snodgrassella alvi]PIT57041.1 hypothetical protein BHC59_05915 [Snodgrassella alvi]